jgi:hypothetical protein
MSLRASRVAKSTASLARQKLKNRARTKVFQRHRRSSRDIAAKLRVNYRRTLKGWLIKTVGKGTYRRPGRQSHQTIGRWLRG